MLEGKNKFQWLHRKEENIHKDENQTGLKIDT